jgi:hypothetical protein
VTSSDVVGGEATCWLCGSGYRPTVTECQDCGLPLLAADDRVGPTADQLRIHDLAELHLSRKERDRVRPALAALPDVLLDDEHVVWLTDAKTGRQRGLLVLSTQALCWIPVDADAEPGAIDLGTIEQVDTWPGDGGQLRVTTATDLHVFTDVGSAVWLQQLAVVIEAARVSPDAAIVEADRLDRSRR